MNSHLKNGSLTLSVIIVSAILATVLALLTVQYRAVSEQVTLTESSIRAKYDAISGLVWASENAIQLPVIAVPSTASAQDFLVFFPQMKPLPNISLGSVSAAKAGPLWVSIASENHTVVVVTCSANIDAQAVLKQAKKLL